MINVTAVQMVKESLEPKSSSVSKEQLEKQMQVLEEMIAKLSAKPSEKKNQKPGKPKTTNSYILVSNKMNLEGAVPQQQLDIAKILTSRMEVGKTYTEAEVFSFLVDGAGEYKSIYASVQDVTYLFRYYRGLKRTVSHANFCDRGLLRLV